MVEMEDPKYVLIKQRQDIVIDLREELDIRNIGGDTYKANGILEEVTRVHGRMMEALGSGIREERVRNDGIPLAEYLQIESDLVNNEHMGNTDLSRGIPRGVEVSQSNCRGGKLILL